MEDDDFLAAIEADNIDAPEADETVEPVVVEQQEAPEPAIEPVAEPVVEPARQEVRPEPQHVPLTAMLDERDKRKAAETELAQIRAQQQQQQPASAPDMFEDPEGFRVHQEQSVQAALYQSNLQWSQRIAAIQHGEEATQQATNWGLERCNADPYFNAKVRASNDPIGFVVSEWKREQIASQVTPDDFAEFKAWKQAQAQINAPAPASPANPIAPRNTPPRSLASAPSAGGILSEAEQTDDEIFAETFKKV